MESIRSRSGAHAPALDAAHLRVEFTLEGLTERQKCAEVGPAQLSPNSATNCRDNVQHLTVDAPADAPIEEGKPYVDGNGSLPAGLLDQGTDLDQQFAGFLALQIQISLPHPYPFTIFTRSRLPMTDIGSMLPRGLEGGDRSLHWS
jgi:hypothetical protein